MALKLTEAESDGAQRLMLAVDGYNLAFFKFFLFGSMAIVTHTEVSAQPQGRGPWLPAGAWALHGERWNVVPVRGFFLEQVRRHPEYAGLLTPHCRRIFMD